MAWAPRAVSVVTASSTSGKACVSELLRRGFAPSAIRACVRSESKVEPIREDIGGHQVNFVTGFDAEQPESLQACFTGSDVAVVVHPHDLSRGLDDAHLGVNMLKAAVDSGVKRLVYVASWTVHEPERVSMIASRFVPGEDYLRSLGGDVQWSVLRGGYFMPNLRALAPVLAGEASPVLRFPHVSLPPVDQRDMGACSAVLAMEPTAQYDRRYFECSGPEMLTYADIAKIFSEVLGRDVKYEAAEDVDAFVEPMPPAFQELIRFMAATPGTGIPFKPDEMPTLLGRPLNTLKEWIEENKAGFQ